MMQPELEHCVWYSSSCLKLIKGHSLQKNKDNFHTLIKKKTQNNFHKKKYLKDHNFLLWRADKLEATW